MSTELISEVLKQSLDIKLQKVLRVDYNVEFGPVSGPVVFCEDLHKILNLASIHQQTGPFHDYLQGFNNIFCREDCTNHISRIKELCLSLMETGIVYKTTPEIKNIMSQ